MITWSWPLVDINWIPEIVSLFNKYQLPSWIILKRELTLLSPNKNLSEYIFRQLKSFLIDFDIVKENNNQLSIIVISNNSAIKEHLYNIYISSKEEWAEYFKYYYKTGQIIKYEDFFNNSGKQYSFITSLSVFKQWGYFFEFIDKAFLLNSKYLYPVTSVSEDLLKNEDFLDALIKRRRDPRLVIETFSRHRKADKLLFTKGETKVSISSDPLISPKINPELIISNLNQESPEAIIQILDSDIHNYMNEIQQSYEPYISNNLQIYIYSSKLFLDYFIYGQKSLECDYIELTTITRLASFWNKELNIKLSQYFWKELPIIYSAVSHLMWNITYFSNYLNRNIDHLYFDEEVIRNKYNKTKISIRCKNSKVSLLRIMQLSNDLYNKIMQPGFEGKIQKIEIALLEMNELNTVFLPEEIIDRKLLLDKLNKYILLSDSEKEELLKGREHFSQSSENRLLGKLSIISRYLWIQEDKYYSTLLNIHKQLDKYEQMLNLDNQELENLMYKSNYSYFYDHLITINNIMMQYEKS